MGGDGSPRPEGARPGLTPPPGFVDPDWLALRGPADVRARDAFAGHLPDALARRLARHSARRDATVRLLDVGAGTGAGARWLRSRLPLEQNWRLVDHDPAILDAGMSAAEPWARGVVADVGRLPQLLAEEPADVVTCQALLDILTTAEVDLLLAAAAEGRAAVLLGLTVTGEVTLDPGHRDDDLVAEAFDAHQRRDGRLGPDAGAYVVEALRRHRYAVTVAATPWHLAAEESLLCRSWLRGRAAAALEQAPQHADRILAWHQVRQAQAEHGGLTAVVGHVDVLGLPARPAVG